MENRADSILQKARRSQRKSKKIDKNRLYYPSHSKAQKDFKHITQFRKDIPIEIKNKAQTFIELNQNSNLQRIVEEMSKAVIDQSLRLYQMLKIKLQFAQKQHFSVKNVAIEQIHQNLQNLDQNKCIQTYLLNQGENQSMNYWSCPQSPPQQLFLRKHQSAKLLCDNYEKHELVCSLQTLIPRPPFVNDLRKQFIDQLHPSS